MNARTAVGDVFYEDDAWHLVTYRSKSGAIRYHEIAWWRAWPRLLWNWATR